MWQNIGMLWVRRGVAERRRLSAVLSLPYGRPFDDEALPEPENLDYETRP